MISLFKTFVGIDYSGAKTPTSRLKGLRVFEATLNSDPMKVKSPAGKKWNWTRKEIAHWCREQLYDKDPVIIGIDHGFSYPMSCMERYRISNWDQFLEDFQKHWPTDEDNSSVESLRKGNKRTGHHKIRRLDFGHLLNRSWSLAIIKKLASVF